MFLGSPRACWKVISGTSVLGAWRRRVAGPMQELSLPDFSAPPEDEVCG